MRCVLTNSVREAWAKYCEKRPDEEFDDIRTIVSEAAPMAERPSCMKDMDATPYQHPDFKSVYFPVVVNEDGEHVFIGLRSIRRVRPDPASPTGRPTAESAVVWEPEPTGVSDRELIAWCERQNAEAFRRQASRECEPKLCVARMAQIGVIRKAAGKRIEAANSAKGGKNERPDFLRGRDKELGAILNFLEGKTLGPSELKAALANYEHRYPVQA